MSLHDRIRRLERPTRKPPGDILWVSTSGVPVTRWSGAVGSVYREWHLNPGEDAEAFRCRVRPEAIAAGILCLSGCQHNAPETSTAA